MKQKRIYEEARIDVVQLSSKAQLLSASQIETQNMQFTIGGFTRQSVKDNTLGD